jgi:hypothetical protein
MTLAEWALWITSTVFQGMLAYYTIWEQSKIIRLKERQMKILELANAKLQSQKDSEVVS